MAKKTKDARVKLAQNKKLRRRWLTWLRMARYGANNFTRNAWLTTAATAVMTITLLILFTTFVARSVLVATADQLRGQLDVPVFLVGDTPQKNIDSLKKKLLADSNVSNVRFASKDESKKVLVDELAADGNNQDLQSLADLDQNLAFPATLYVTLKDLGNVDSLENLIKNDNEFKDYLSPAIESTFKGDKLKTINVLNSWTQTAERIGLIASVLFVGISTLIIFNTIRMAIFNRKEEIQMMKLIGADKSFIRGPFVVEAVMYGFIAALIATVIGYFGLISLEPKIASYGIAIGELKNDLIMYAPIILVIMIVVGSLIGIISSRLAVRRYLKV